MAEKRDIKNYDCIEKNYQLISVWIIIEDFREPRNFDHIVDYRKRYMQFYD